MSIRSGVNSLFNLNSILTFGWTRDAAFVVCTGVGFCRDEVVILAAPEVGAIVLAAGVVKTDAMVLGTDVAAGV